MRSTAGRRGRSRSERPRPGRRPCVGAVARPSDGMSPPNTVSAVSGAGVERDEWGAHRRAWLRIDSLAINPETAELLVFTAGLQGWSLIIDSDEPRGWLAVIDDLGGGGSRISGFVGRWRDSDREYVSR